MLSVNIFFNKSYKFLKTFNQSIIHPAPILPGGITTTSMKQATTLRTAGGALYMNFVWWHPLVPHSPIYCESYDYFDNGDLTLLKCKFHRRANCKCFDGIRTQDSIMFVLCYIMRDVFCNARIINVSFYWQCL